MRKPENIRLLQQAIACFDDAQAYKQLFVIFQPSLLQFATSMLGSLEVAEEIVSDVFIKIWEKRQQLDKVENLQYYLFTAVKNRALNYLNDKKKNFTTNIDNSPVELKSIYHDPEQKMISAETINEIQRTINQLPPRCQLIFKLIKEDGLKYKEVAELLHISIKTVENQMTLALKKIITVFKSRNKSLAEIFSKN